MPETGGDFDEIHRALLRRTTRAVERIVRTMPADLLASALAAPSDFGALARAVGDPRVAEPSRAIDPLAGAIGRSIGHREEIAALAGEMLSSAQVSTHLGISRQAIDKRRKTGKLLAVRVGSDWLYPAFQFERGEVMPGFPAVLQAYAGVDPWVVIDAVLAPDDALGGRCLMDAIRAGDEAAVARHVGQMRGDGFA